MTSHSEDAPGGNAQIILVTGATGNQGGAAAARLPQGDLSIISTTLPSARVRNLQEQMPGLTAGEGVLEAGFGGYRPVRGRVPAR